MRFKKYIAKAYAKYMVSRLRKVADHPLYWQEKTMDMLIHKARDTQFGKDHNLADITRYSTFKSCIPIRDYEALRLYIDRVVDGESDVLWPGRPTYLCKTSGTTSGAKYIPITSASMSHHVDAAKMAILCYIDETGDADFIDGKFIFLQGSPVLSDLNGTPLGRLSGITAHWVPSYLQTNRLPSWPTNRIEDWETKVDAIVDETLAEDLRLVSGIPSWVHMYFERLIKRSGKDNIAQIFPNLSLFVHGGVNFQPYTSIFNRLIGKSISCIETYPSSEGFIAFQDTQDDQGLLLNVNAGIFFEFIPANDFHSDSPPRFWLKDVKLDVNYVIILNTNAGLWGYNIGDTVVFTSLNPYKIKVSGRITHFTSAFGEHVIGSEVENAMQETLSLFDLSVREFHLAPEIHPAQGLPHHQWFIEFESIPKDEFELESFRLKLDHFLQSKNPYYKDLITGKTISPLKIRLVRIGGFVEMMKSRGKLGGQNKIPRLANTREIATQLETYVIE